MFNMKINEKNLCAFASTPPFDMEGFLNKRGEVNKAFQKRYFVLKGNLLFYFEKKGDKEPLGLIIVEGCTIELSAENDQYCFEIDFNGNRTYVLSAESQESMELWMKSLTCAGYEYKKLMLAELQRQLEEIEDSRNKIQTEPTLTTSAPKPPPRRQNPFNRPAPPLPGHSDNNLNSIFINGQYSTNMITSYTQTETDASRIPSSKSTNVNYLNKQSKPNRMQSKTNKSAPAITIIQGNTSYKNTIDTFEQFHETMRPLVMKDVLEYRMQQILKSQPLIKF